MMLPAQLIGDLRDKRILLFAGAGVSAVLNLPNWSGLIDKMADELGFDPDLFQRLGSFPTLAEYYLSNGRGRAGLAKWLYDEWHSVAIDISTSRVHAAIVGAQFPIIYTTNYDQWLERAHDCHGVGYSRIVHGEDIPNARDGNTQIVKFHGDLTVPETMVLTETDYFERLKFESELDLKLRADLLRHNVLFVGYSLSDVNIRNILYRLSLFRRTYRTTRSKAPRSYVYVDRQNDVQATLFRDWGIETLLSPEIDRTAGLEAFMASIEGYSAS